VGRKSAFIHGVWVSPRPYSPHPPHPDYPLPKYSLTTKNEQWGIGGSNIMSGSIGIVKGSIMDN